VIFTRIRLQDAYIIDIEKREDHRGFFARSWCAREFEERGLSSHLVQCNVSFNHQRGTVRGMHYQLPPYEEAKLVRCTRGAIYDVLIDLRPHSLSYLQWFGTELTAANYRMLYVPEGFAHGFETLEDGTEVTYQVSQFYTPRAEHGLRYDDPGFAIQWPMEVQVVSPKDRSWPNYEFTEMARSLGQS
jgi:dTDP-4-dehydrorhamnose 3,5-epimerase